jgi:acetate CoA/acetoacetate CoA-transferase alpha subunit
VNRWHEWHTPAAKKSIVRKHNKGGEKMALPDEFGKIKSLDAAMEYIKDGMTIMIPGFGGVGTSPMLIEAIIKKQVKDLVLIGCDGGDNFVGHDLIIRAGLVSKLINSHIGATPNTGKLMNEGNLEVELCPQGSLIERIRAGGAGLGGILTEVGLGTPVEENKKKVEIDGVKYLVETALRADIAIIYAKQADTFGNLIYDKTARNFNPAMAMAADVTIVHAEEIVPLGALDPEAIVTQGAFVDVIVTGTGGEWQWPWQQR